MSRRFVKLCALLFTFSCDVADTPESACSDYCDKRAECDDAALAEGEKRVAECDDEVDVDDCNETCTDVMEECDDAEEDAIEDLRECAEESCDDVAGCGFDQANTFI
jgi:hypothetical protein